MMLAIRVLREGLVVREELFRSTPVTIGRAPDRDLVLTDPTVSRVHATIDRDSEGHIAIAVEPGAHGLYVGPAEVARTLVQTRLRARLGLCEIEIEEVSGETTQPISVQELRRLDQRRTPLTWAAYLAVTLAALNLDAAMAPGFWSPWNSERGIGLVWLSASVLVAILIFASVLLGLLKAAARKVRMADVFQHFAAYSWLLPLSAAASLLVYYIGSDSSAAALRSLLPALATIAFLAQAASIRRPPPNRLFRFLWASALILVWFGFGLTRAYGSKRMGEPSLDHTVQAPIPGLGTGPAVSFEEYGGEVEAAGARSQAQVR